MGVWMEREKKKGWDVRWVKERIDVEVGIIDDGWMQREGGRDRWRDGWMG